MDESTNQVGMESFSGGIATIQGRRHEMVKNVFVAGCLSLVLVPVAFGQGKSLGATLGVQVFPKEGQSTEQQSKDEGECYDWAVQNSGVDPFELQKKETEQAQQAQAASEAAAGSARGAGARGAVGGAVAGAVIGEIANDDAGKGAAYGAAAGAISARRKARSGEQQAQAQIKADQQQAKQYTEEQRNQFRNGFSACLEAKGYIAKY